jgi:hypothetical protein
MATLTKRNIPHQAIVYLGFSSLCVAALLGACSDGASGTSGNAAGSGGHGGASAGQSGGGTSAGMSSAGSVNHAGSGGAAGTATSGGSGGTGGSGGAAAGSGGTGGSGGSGGMACAATDKCCDDPNKTEPGMCGCGTPDDDDDKDGKLNCKEACPSDPEKTEAGMCGCGTADNDSDDDGIVDCKPGHFLEAEDGVLSHVDVAVTPIDTGEGGAGGAGGADGAGGAPALPESFTIGSDAKASKGKYLESPAGFTSDALPGPARATYAINIPVAKKYVFWGRFYTPNLNHNRVWVKVDDGVWMKLRVTTGETWFWYTFHQEGMFDVPIQYDLTKGAHTFSIASDSDGARVDRFYVTPGGERPAGDDTVCNPPHTIQVGDVCQSSCGMLQGNSCDAVMCAGKTPLPAYDCDVCCTL